jgi:hypothetical protein
MKLTTTWFRKSPSSRPRRRASPANYRPALELLEDRRLLSVSASSFDDVNGAFIRYSDGEVWRHDVRGFLKVDINATSISAGSTDIGGILDAAVYIVYNTGQLFQWTPSAGGTPAAFHYIDTNVRSVSGSSGVPDEVFILYNNGELFFHSPVSGFSLLEAGVKAMSASNQGVFFVQTNGLFSEWRGGNDFRFVDSNVVSVSASLRYPETAYILYDTGALYQFVGGAGTTFTPIDNNVASVAAADTAPTGPGTFASSAYYVTESGVLIEWQPPDASHPGGFYNFVDVNVASVSAVEDQPDRVFIVYTNGELFQHDGLSRIPGFQFIDSNVAP